MVFSLNLFSLHPGWLTIYCPPPQKNYAWINGGGLASLSHVCCRNQPTVVNHCQLVKDLTYNVSMTVQSSYSGCLQFFTIRLGDLPQMLQLGVVFSWYHQPWVPVRSTAYQSHVYLQDPWGRSTLYSRNMQPLGEQGTHVLQVQLLAAEYPSMITKKKDINETDKSKNCL